MTITSTARTFLLFLIIKIGLYCTTTVYSQVQKFAYSLEDNNQILYATILMKQISSIELYICIQPLLCHLSCSNFNALFNICHNLARYHTQTFAVTFAVDYKYELEHMNFNYKKTYWL